MKERQQALLPAGTPAHRLQSLRQQATLARLMRVFTKITAGKFQTKDDKESFNPEEQSRMHTYHTEAIPLRHQPEMYLLSHHHYLNTLPTHTFLSRPLRLQHGQLTQYRRIIILYSPQHSMMSLEPPFQSILPTAVVIPQLLLSNLILPFNLNHPNGMADSRCFPRATGAVSIRADRTTKSKSMTAFLAPQTALLCPAARLVSRRFLIIKP